MGFNWHRENNPPWQQYDAAWEDTAALIKRLRNFLQTAASGLGFRVITSGVIELDNVRPLRATWKTEPALHIAT